MAKICIKRLGPGKEANAPAYEISHYILHSAVESPDFHKGEMPLAMCINREKLRSIA